MKARDGGSRIETWISLILQNTWHKESCLERSWWQSPMIPIDDSLRMLLLDYHETGLHTTLKILTKDMLPLIFCTVIINYTFFAVSFFKQNYILLAVSLKAKNKKFLLSFENRFWVSKSLTQTFILCFVKSRSHFVSNKINLFASAILD